MILEALSGVKHEEKGLCPKSPITFQEKYYREDSFVRMHYHSSYEINICNDLVGVINLEGKSFDLSHVQMVFLSPGSLHSYRIKSCTGSVKVWHLGIHLMPLINNDILNEIFRSSSYQISSDREKSLRIEELIDDIIISDSLKQSGLLLNLLHFFSNSSEKNRGIIKNSFLHKIINWSEKNCHDNIDLDQASSAVHLSRFHFSRKFKEHTGSTYMEYLNNLRLENSLIYLTNGESVSLTAEKSGFSDVSYYIKKFKQIYAKTPLEYQKSLMGNKLEYEEY